MAAQVINLKCRDFADWLRGVIGQAPAGTAAPLRVRHPSAFEIENEGPCRGAVRCRSVQAWLELRRVLLSYQRQLPLRVTSISSHGKRWLLVEVAQ